MTMLPLPDGTQSLPWLAVGFFSAWGGLVRYLMDIRHSGTKWCWAAVISQMTISSFTGFLGGFYIYEQNGSNFMALFAAGLSSTLGGTLLRWLWKRFLKAGS